MKRYLVKHAFTLPFQVGPGSDVKPGMEIELEDWQAEEANRAYSYALMEMSPKTKTDWAPDEDVR